MNQNKWIIVAFLALSVFAKVILIPIFLALFLTMLLDPLVKRVIRLKLSRPLASTVVVSFFAVCAVFIGWLCYTAGLEIYAALPTYIAKVNSFLIQAGELSSKLSPAVSLDAQSTEVQLSPSYPELTHFAFNSLGPVLEFVSILFIVPLLMFYFLIDKENLLESFNVINGRYFNLPKLNFELPRMLRVFFAANLATGAFLVVVQGLLFLTVGYDNWISLALLTGFLTLIPVVGGFLAVAASLLLGVGVVLTFPVGLTITAAIIAFHVGANNLIVPLVVGSRLNINAVALIIGLMFWSWIWGVAGFFLAVPMTCLLKLLLECNRETYAFANLMASKPSRVLSGRSVASQPVVVPVQV